MIGASLVLGYILVLLFTWGLIRGGALNARQMPQGEYEKRRIKVYIYARRAEPWDITSDKFVVFLSSTSGLQQAALVGETTVDTIVPTQQAIEQQILLSERLRNDMINEGYRA